MKKFTIFALVIALTFALTACGRRDDAPTETMPTATEAPTAPATMPTIDPTMGTNIPDPTVDDNSTDMPEPGQDSQNGSSESGSGSQGQSDNGTGGNGQNGSGSGGQGSSGQGGVGGSGSTGGQ